MIRSPLDICRERKWETGATGLAIVVVLLFPVTLALGAFVLSSSAEEWLERYTPIVYLSAATSAEQSKALAGEIEGWPTVAEVEIREPRQAMRDLESHLGAETVHGLGLTPTMLPASLIIRPTVPVVGHIDLVSRVAGLEARMEVEAVEIPTSEPLQVLHFAGLLTVVGAFLALLGLLASAVLLIVFLRRMRAQEREEDRVLTLLGARPSELRRPSIVRGAAVGGGCGAFVTGVCVLGLVGWQLYVGQTVGFTSSLPLMAWALTVAPVLLVPVVGALAGLVAGREPVAVWGTP